MNIREAVRALRRRQTVAEARLWAALRGHQLDRFKFQRQYPVGRFVADFYCPEAKLVIEVDGGVHESDEQRLRDRDRDDHFASLGLTVLRVTNDDVMSDLPSVLARVRTTLRQ